MLREQQELFGPDAPEAARRSAALAAMAILVSAAKAGASAGEFFTEANAVVIEV